MAGTTIVDGSLDFSGGVDSVKVTTIASEANPNGLKRNELAWLNNGTVRDGGITQRFGWTRLGKIHDGNVLYQGGAVYEPDSANPYLLFALGGHVHRVIPDGCIVTDLSGPTYNKSLEQSYFCQAENFMIVQAGDNIARPLFWDGTTLVRSTGITNRSVPPGTPGVNQIPPGTAMDYYMGRLWYAQGRRYSAGDIVGGQSGTAGNAYRDSVLNVTENPLVLGGDGFVVPTQAGNIRAIFHNANLNTALGQGTLFIGTRKAVYSLQVPVTRSNWIAATDQTQPLQTVVQLVNGPVSDRSITKANGDIFYQSLEPGIRSLFSAVRYFNQWGNVSLSANEERLLAFNDRALLHAASGTVFDNRLLMTALPKTSPVGIVHQALIPMDFIPISHFGANLVPVWEGMYEGLDFLQLFTADFGGLERCFASVVSRLDGSIELWELTDYLRTDINASGEARSTTIIEFPAYTWGQEFLLKKLVTAELWVDRLSGTVDFTMEWRPDGDPCWHTWHRWKQCSARNTCEDVHSPVCYPIGGHCDGFRAMMTLPKPPEICVPSSGRPAHIGYQFQTRLTYKGYCRIRGLMLHAEPVEKKLYQGIVC